MTNKNFHWWEEVDKKSKDTHDKSYLFNPSQEIFPLLEHFEGFSPTAYLDTIASPPVWTLGHGFTKNVKKGDTITYEESVKRKQKELNEHWQGLASAIHVSINQNICDALSSWSYNVGVSAARNSTLVRLLDEEDYQGAADQLLRWDKAGGKSVKGLTRRRKAERNVFLGKNWREFYE